MEHSDLLLRSATDAEFRDALVADPRAVLAEHGVAIPEDVEVRIEQSTPTELVIAIPPALGDDVELDEEALAGASGGTMFIPVLLWGAGAVAAGTGAAVGGYELVKHI